MATIDELLNATTESQACTIDPDTRVITVPSCYTEFGVEADEKVNRINFQCPKVVGDNIDLTAFNLYINYMNANGEYNAYLVDDVTVSGDNITFSWLLSRHVTEKSGTVNYIVCAKKSDDTGVVNEWNTKVATGTVGVGLEATAEIEEQNADIIEQILKKISDIENNEVVSNKSLNITGATVGQTVKISAVDSNGVPTAWEPVDMVSGGIGQFRHIRKVTIPEDITTDTTGVNFSARDNGGYFFGFSTDENGNSFELTELLIFSEAGGVGASQTFSLDVNSDIPQYFQESFQTKLTVGSSGKKGYSMSHSFLAADGMSYAYGATFGGGGSNNVYTLSKETTGPATSIKKIRVGAINNSGNGFVAGSWFDFYGR